MNTQKFTNKLQRAYHTMVDMVNLLVDVEYKSLDEAIEIAEEKLSEWEELTSHEVEKISAEVKLDVSTLVDTLAEARQAYRDQIALETLYLKEESIEKLAQIADKTTLELAQFNRNLKERVQIATEEQSEQEHHEHRQWDSEHAMWLEDIAMWKNEHQQIQAQLYSIQDGIHQHGIVIEKHAKAIHAHQAQEHQHEVAMADVEQNRNTTDQQLVESQSSHNKMKKTHTKQAKLHNKLKQHHKDVVVLIAKLNKQFN